MSTIALIPARGGSKRLPRKNVLPFHGRPLMVWTIAAARDVGCDRVVVTTDDDEIAAVAIAAGAEVVRRPLDLATDTAPVIGAILHALDGVGATDDDRCILLQPTSPLRTAADITAALAIARVHPDVSVMSVRPIADRTLAWSFVERDGVITPILGWDVLRVRSQDLPPLVVPNGALYIARVGRVRAMREVAPAPIRPCMMAVERSIDIDTAEDFAIAEHLFLGGVHTPV